MRKLTGSNRGNAMVEFALSWAVLALLFTGIFDFGYTAWAYNTLETGVATAAQAAAKMSWDASSPDTFNTAIQNMVVYGNPNGGTSPVLPGLSTSNVTVDLHASGGFPTNITVAISNYTVNSVFGSRTFNKPRVTVVYIGQVTCSC